METQTETAVTRETLTERDRIMAALATWIRQRPGLDFANYGSVAAYRAESRSVTRDLRDAETLLAAVRRRSGIDADALKAAFRGAYSGRLSWDGERGALSYCTGQYWPTEYRRAACAVLASALWAWAREYAMPRAARGGDGHDYHDGPPAGDWLRRHFRCEFGPRIARRWFG